MKKIIIWFILIAVTLNGIYYLMIESLHNNLMFFPSKSIVATPAQDGIDFEEVYIKTKDGETLHGYYLPSDEKTDKVVIYLHGNGDNVGGWYTGPVQIQNYMPINALLIDYRGYGNSTGSPSVDGVIKDSYAMYEYLIERGFKPENISVYGRSLGGGVAIELAAKYKVKAIAVQSSFSSLRDVAKDLYPYIPSFLIKNNSLNSSKIIKDLNVPVLIGHGSMDEVIPVSHSYKLYELANEPKKLIIQEGAMHNNVGNYLDKEYFEALKEFFLN